MSGIKDYIIDVEKESKVDTKKKVTSSTPNFSLVLSNDMDIIIKRKTARLDKDLVLLVSQDLFYIKDNKTNKIDALDYDNCAKLISGFLRGYDSYSSKINLEKVSWVTNVNKDKFVDMIRNEQKRILLKEGLLGISSYHEYKAFNLLEKNKKLAKYYHKKIKDFGYGDLIDALIWLDKNVNYNNAKYLIDVLYENTDYDRSGDFDDFLSLSSEYNLDVNTLINYITSGLYSQGIQCANWSVRRNYRDYLRMNQEMYGKVKEKYPKHLMTDHDKVVLKYNLWNRYKDDLALIDISKEYLDLAYKGKECSIIIPSNSADIVNEGIGMSNCVGSYVKRIANGETFVCFMRKNEDIEESYVTIEVRDKEVCQCRGYANRNTTEQEDKFIKKWAKEKNLKITYKTI